MPEMHELYPRGVLLKKKTNPQTEARDLMSISNSDTKYLGGFGTSTHLFWVPNFLLL